MNDFLTLSQTAEKWKISTRRLRKLCEEGRIDGVVKFGKYWAIPMDAVKPGDKRIKSGKYIKPKIG